MVEEAQNWMEVAFGVATSDAEDPAGTSAGGTDFGRVNLTTPVLPPYRSDLPELVEQARASLRAGTVPDHPPHPLPVFVLGVQEAIIRGQLMSYLDNDRPPAHRLYVLEFQGRDQDQYVMFGHTKDLITRVRQHCLAATPHRFALLAGWASPGVDNAQPLEQMALDFGSFTHSHFHYRERFYEMPFETGLNIVRTVFELHSDWRSRTAKV